MNISIDVNYFVNQIKSEEDKELLKLYYENINEHIKISKEYIKLKKSLLELLIKYQSKNAEEIKKSINIIESDAIEYKNTFKKELFKLINN